jgi:hypothetical protein
VTKFFTVVFPYYILVCTGVVAVRVSVFLLGIPPRRICAAGACKMSGPEFLGKNFVLDGWDELLL